MTIVREQEKRPLRFFEKNFFFSFFGDIFGILGEYPLRIWFSDPHGTCRF